MSTLVERLKGLSILVASRNDPPRCEGAHQDAHRERLAKTLIRYRYRSLFPKVLKNGWYADVGHLVVNIGAPELDLVEHLPNPFAPAAAAALAPVTGFHVQRFLCPA